MYVKRLRNPSHRFIVVMSSQYMRNRLRRTHHSGSLPQGHCSIIVHLENQLSCCRIFSFFIDLHTQSYCMHASRTPIMCYIPARLVGLLTRNSGLTPGCHCSLPTLRWCHGVTLLLVSPLCDCNTKDYCNTKGLVKRGSQPSTRHHGGERRSSIREGHFTLPCCMTKGERSNLPGLIAEGCIITILYIPPCETKVERSFEPNLHLMRGLLITEENKIA